MKDGYLLLNVYSLIVLCVLSFVFFHKKRMHQVEDVTYSKILIFGILTMIFGVVSGLPLLVDSTEYAIQFVSKMYLIGLLGIFILFFSYTLYVSNYYHFDPKKQKNVLTVCFSICAFLIFIFPFYFDIKEGSVLISGLSVSFTYYVFGAIYSLLIIALIMNGKKILDKKYIPIILFVFGGILLFAAQLFLVNLNFLTNPYVVLICLIMYFTIENPDVKMIQQLEVAREQADKANRAKTDFLSSMSHEIRTPLNAIVGFSDCIMDAHTLNEAQENAKDIVNASQTLLEIVNGILDISKIEAGKIEIINSKYNAPETFEELAKLITPKMNEKGLDFTYNIAPDLPKTLFGDHANIKKIVTNLLSNACKYTDKGFVHYEVSCINSKGVSKLIISVEDSGRGIKKDSIDKMFTKFQRLDEDRNTTIEGTGLGLAITKQLIELMGGRIIVHTVYGEGSKFTVVLNQRIETDEVEDSKKVKTTLDLHNVRILIVDDTPLNIKVACKLLERYNANNLVASDSGFDCIARIQRGEMYDLILLDDMMPKMSGVETLKKLKELPGFKIPTIALTANAITGMREKYLADGFDDFLAKPIEKEQMIQVFNQILGRNVTEELTIPEEVKQEAIRGEEIPNTEDIEKAEEERQKNGIIPVEENIEEILGSQVERNYLEKTFSMKPVGFAKVDEIEQLEEEEPPKEIPHVDLVPVVDINIPLPKKEEESYDRSYLEKNGADINHALELLGDMDMYNMTIHDFMSEVEAKWGRILDYKEKNDMPNYAIEVHSLKSDCKYLGFMSLADIAYQHELKSKENDSNFVNEHFAELEEEYRKVLEVARTYVEHNPVNNS